MTQVGADLSSQLYLPNFLKYYVLAVEYDPSTSPCVPAWSLSEYRLLIAPAKGSRPTEDTPILHGMVRLLNAEHVPVIRIEPHM